jgi:hypothetical protein
MLAVPSVQMMVTEMKLPPVPLVASAPRRDPNNVLNLVDAVTPMMRHGFRMEVVVEDVVQKILDVYDRDGRTLKRLANTSFCVVETSGQWLIRLYRDGNGCWIGRWRWGEDCRLEVDGWTEILDMDAGRVSHDIHPIK